MVLWLPPQTYIYRIRIKRQNRSTAKKIAKQQADQSGVIINAGKAIQLVTN
jgi:hypothetical protein